MGEQDRSKGELPLPSNVEAELGGQALEGTGLFDSQRSAALNLAGYAITSMGDEIRYYATIPGAVAVIDASKLRK